MSFRNQELRRKGLNRIAAFVSDELADRVIEKLEQARKQGRLEGLYDAD